MDKFVVDIDAVLDEFEQSESSKELQRKKTNDGEKNSSRNEAVTPPSEITEKAENLPSSVEEKAPLDVSGASKEDQGKCFAEDSERLNENGVCEEEENRIVDLEGINEAVNGLEVADEAKRIEKNEATGIDSEGKQPEATRLGEDELEGSRESEKRNGSEILSTSETQDETSQNPEIDDKPENNEEAELAEPEKAEAEILRISETLDSGIQSETSNGPEQKHEQLTSPAVKPKTSSPSTAHNSPGVSSQQFDEFLRKKSLETAHLLSSTHNSPVFQRFRTTSPQLSTPSSERKSDSVRRNTNPESTKERSFQSEMSLDCPEVKQSTPNSSGFKENCNEGAEESLEPAVIQGSSVDESRAIGDDVTEADGNTDKPLKSRSPLRSDTSNFYRIVSFDMSAIEVTEDELLELEREDPKPEDRAPSRRSQDSGASIEPVAVDQTIQSEMAENVVNNNEPEETDNPFVGTRATEVAVSSEAQIEQSVENPSEQNPDVVVPCDQRDDTDQTEPSDARDSTLSDDTEGAVGGTDTEEVLSPTEEQIGKVKPMWIHDEDAPICMNCGQDFTMFRRRHHCRACGKVLCGACCKDRARLQFLDGEMARVCTPCLTVLHRAYTLPPVMVPVGVLKKGERSGQNKSTGGNLASKSVMFSDGIRPGGDLTDLDIPSTPPSQRTPQRRIKQMATGRSQVTVAKKYKKYTSISDSLGFLPNVLLTNEFPLFDKTMPAGTLFNLLQDPSLPPVIFAMDVRPIRPELLIRVKIVTLDCCVGSRVWSFCSEGLACYNQEEIAVILEYQADDELAVPRDIFKLYEIVIQNAIRGTTVNQMDHLLFPGGLLGSNEHAGFLFLRKTLQCTEKIVTPIIETSYLVAMLILKSEVPWAKLFPLRLLLRLGAESRYYPCSLVSVRQRQAVFLEGNNQSILGILADFRNYQYTIQNIPGLVIHMKGKKTTILAPKNRYDQMMKASSTSENIMAIGANFSSVADAHLVCVQNPDGSFQSQTINIASRQVQITGASFLVFSGALKSNSGYTAKSSIVEDGLLVQITANDMVQLKQAIHAMTDYKIVCKETKPSTESGTDDEETVELIWTENEKTVNEHVISVIDGQSLAGVHSCKIYDSTDFSNQKFVVRWSEVFFLVMRESELDLPNPNRLIITTAAAMCICLLPHAPQLYEKELTKIALRISLDPDRFGYEIGSCGKPLGEDLIGEVDNALIPIITSLDGSHQPMTIELVFYVLLK